MINDILLGFICILLAVLLGFILVTSYKSEQKESRHLSEIADDQQSGIEDYEAVKERAKELEEVSSEEAEDTEDIKSKNTEDTKDTEKTDTADTEDADKTEDTKDEVNATTSTYQDNNSVNENITQESQVVNNKPTISTMSVKESAKKLAVVAQHNYYNFDFSVEEVVLMGRSPHKKRLEPDNSKDYQIVNESLDKVGMLEFKNRSFSTLSGGEQQRVILARALAQQTPCLILDEPTNHLDIKYQLSLLNIVKDLDLTIVAAIHDLNIAAMYCDRLFVMKNGKIVGSGTPQEVLTKEFIKEIYDIDVEIVNDSKGDMHILYSR